MIVYPVYEYYRDSDGDTSWAQHKVFRTEAGRDEFLEAHPKIIRGAFDSQTWYEPWPTFKIEDK